MAEKVTTDLGEEPQTSPKPDTKPVWKGSLSAKEPQAAPDGHENLSQADIDARDQ